jgi:hypothetical protein
MTSEQLLEHVGETSDARAVIETLLLGDDLLQRDALMGGEIEEVHPAVLSVPQVRNEQPLPPYLIAESGEQLTRKIVTDTVWEAYFHHASNIARRTGNAFLNAWVTYEVTLRNALAARRAKALELEEADYLVATDLADEEYDFTATLGEWSAAANPLAGLQVLDRARWAFLEEHDRYFSFADDELAAYAARLILLQRWDRLTAESRTEKAEQ